MAPKNKEETKPASGVKLAGVFNRGRNTYTHTHCTFDADGNETSRTEYRLAPSEFKRVPLDVYEKFWADVTEFGVRVLQLAEGAPLESPSATEAALRAQNEELAKKLAEAEKLLAEATKPLV